MPKKKVDQEVAVEIDEEEGVPVAVEDRDVLDLDQDRAHVPDLEADMIVKETVTTEEEAEATVQEDLDQETEEGTEGLPVLVLGIDNKRNVLFLSWLVIGHLDSGIATNESQQAGE